MMCSGQHEKYTELELPEETGQNQKPIVLKRYVRNL